MVFKYKGYLWWWCIKYGVLNAKVIYVGGVKIQWLFMMMVSKYSGYLWWWFINTVSWVWPCFQVTLCEFAHVFRSLLWIYLCFQATIVSLPMFSGLYCEFTYVFRSLLWVCPCFQVFTVSLPVFRSLLWVCSHSPWAMSCRNLHALRCGQQRNVHWGR